MSDQVYEKIKSLGNLPSPSDVVMEITRLAWDPESKLEEISALIKRDPGIAMQILKYANSPLTGFVSKVLNLDRAIVLLGRRTVVNLSLVNSLLSKSRSGQCSNFDYEEFWSDSVARAATAKRLTGDERGINSSEAFTCGLICQIGRLALATAFPEQYAQVLTHVDSADFSVLADAEKHVFEIDHNQLAAEMMADWYLPVYFCDAVRFQEIPNMEDARTESQTHQLVKVLYLAGLMSPVLLESKIEKEALPHLMAAVGQIPLPPDSFAQAFDDIGEGWQKVGDIFAVRTRAVEPWAKIHAKVISI